MQPTCSSTIMSVVQDAVDRFADKNMSIKNNEDTVLRQYCTALDILSDTHDFDVCNAEVTEDGSLNITIQMIDLYIKKSSDLLMQLGENADKFGFKANDEDSILVWFLLEHLFTPD